jgi:hypothetical protein
MNFLDLSYLVQEFFPQLLAPYQSTTTTGSSPTTQASCPLGNAVTSPGPAMNSVPSSFRIPSLEEGRRISVVRLEGPVVEEARLLVASLEGAMLVARSYGDPKRFGSAAERVLAGVLPSGRMTKDLRRARPTAESFVGVEETDSKYAGKPTVSFQPLLSKTQTAEKLVCTLICSLRAVGTRTSWPPA